MKIFKEIASLKIYLHSKRNENTKIGFVPTMGALHKGHISLINVSAKENDITVCSIFVNPKQFNNSYDLSTYPKTIENDIKLLEANNCDVLFYPDENEIYPEHEITANEDFGFITKTLEGEYRPGHFDGVITIVKKLFEIIEPDNVYFGQKDFQQCAVVDQIIKRNDFSIQLKICETLREDDGLAMSSRNIRLNDEERKTVIIIPQTLFWIKENYRKYKIDELKLMAINKIISSSTSLKIDYLEIVDQVSLKPITEYEKGKNTLVLLALWCGNVRLIDNMILTN